MMEPDGFSIRISQFEGPFDLLLFFIERDELDIHDVPIARITDDFLNYLAGLNALNIELASEFIFVAATLMRIKAKMLLPRPEMDELGHEIDMKEELLAKLLEYKKFKELALELRDMESERSKQVKRGNIAADLALVSKGLQPGEELASFDLYKLMVIYERVMKRYRERHDRPVHTVIQYPYTIENQKKLIANLIKINKSLDFKELMKHSENKMHFVFNFLAMLEMLQQQLISIDPGLGYNDFSVKSNAFTNA